MKTRDMSRLLLAAASLLALITACTRIDLIAFASGVPLSDGTAWTAHQLAVDIGSEGTWDTNHVRNGAVIKDADLFKMWYAGFDGANSRVVYAESTDGKSWGSHEQALDLGNLPPYDDNGILYPAVTKLGSWLEMWYNGSGGTGIVYCRSTDGGKNWGNFELAVDLGSQGTYDTDHVWAASVIREGDLYRMWYTGSDASLADRIIYCDSQDGRNWEHFQLAVDLNSLPGYDEDSANTPTVIRDGGLYKMWYTGVSDLGGRCVIAYCESVDGVSWRKFRLAFASGAEGTYDTTLVTDPVVINDHGTGMMWYRGSDGATGRLIYCESN